MLNPELTITDYVRVIKRRRWIIFLTFFSVILFSILLSYFTLPVYRAESTVMAERPKQVSGVLAGMTVQAQVNLESEAQLLRSERVLKEALREVSPESRDLSDQDFDVVLDKASKRVQVEINARSNLLLVSVTDQNPEYCAALANAIAKAYGVHSGASRSEETAEARKFVEARIKENKERLDEQFDKIKAFRVENKITDIGIELRSILDQMSEAFKNRSAAITAEQLAIGKRESVLKKKGLTVEALGFIVDDAGVRDLRAKLNAATARCETLERRYTDTNPFLVAARAEQAAAKKRYEEELQIGIDRELARMQQEIDSLGARRTAMDQIISSINDNKSDLPEKQAIQQRMEEEAIIVKSLLSGFQRKLEELQILEQQQKGARTEILRHAIVPSTPIRPNKVLNLVVGMVAGMVLGFFLAFLIETIDDSAATIEEVENHVHLPVLGLIPKIQNAERSDEEEMVRPEKGLYPSSRCVVFHDPKSILAESFRILRTNILFMTMRKPNQTILITSSLSGEGKSFLTVNLGITFAQLGSKVLLVDLNLRDPELHDYFGISKNPGVTDLLIGEFKYNEAIHQTPISNLSLLTSGPIPPNPSEQITSVQMANLICTLRENFDLVLFDSSPAIPVTDPAILASMVDKTILVYDTMRSSLQVVKRSKTLLSNVSGSVVGVVMNQLGSTLFQANDMPLNYYYAKKEERHVPSAVDTGAGHS